MTSPAIQETSSMTPNDNESRLDALLGISHQVDHTCACGGSSMPSRPRQIIRAASRLLLAVVAAGVSAIAGTFAASGYTGLRHDQAAGLGVVMGAVAFLMVWRGK
jgi:hypothetical protein